MSKFSYNNRRSNYIMSPLQTIYPPPPPEPRVATPIPVLKKEKSVRDLIPLFDKCIKEESEKVALKVFEKDEPPSITKTLSLDSCDDLKPFPTENKIMNKLLKLSRFKSVK